jgi:hypothetical protein
MKIAIIVLSCDGRYESLVQGIRKTWGSIKHPNIDIYYNYADRINKKANRAERNKTQLFGDEIVNGYPDGRYQVHKKTLDSFQWLKENKKYDYVFRCCCGCYVIQENLYKFLQDKPKNNFYCGVFGETQHGIFCSGSGFFLSWDLLEDIVINREKVTNVFQDDVNIGRYLTKDKNIVPVYGQRWDYNNRGEIKSLSCLTNKNYYDESDGAAHKPPEQLGYNYHYHLAHSFTGSSFYPLHQCYLNNKFCD